MSLVLKFYFTSSMLNMFRTLIHPSSGACDISIVSPHWLCVLVSMCVGVSLWLVRVVSCRRLQPATRMPTKESNGIWRIKTNRELDEFIEHRNTTNYVKAQRLSWFGHTNRMPETSIVKRINFTGRPAGMPKSRWEDDVRNDLKKMKLMKWAEQVQDRLKWENIVE